MTRTASSFLPTRLKVKTRKAEKREASTKATKKMQLRDSIQKKSKRFFSRTLQGLNHLLLFHGYPKLPRSRASSFRAFSCASCREQAGKAPKTEESYSGFSRKWTPAQESYSGLSGKWAQEGVKEGGKDGSISVGEEVSVPKEGEEAEKVEKVKVGISYPPPSSRGEGGGSVLVKKMRELEMMELGDMEHVLDVEEAIHYYSRLTSPAYVGIVDKFFMDMYSDFSSSSPAAPGPSLAGSSLRSRLQTRQVPRSAAWN